MKNKIWLTISFFLIIIGSLSLIYSIPPESVQEERKEWTAPESADTLENPFSDKREGTAAGRKLFQTTCFVCHGASGEGDGVGAKGLQPQPKDLTSDEVQKQSDGAIFWKITAGNIPMASYKDIFTEEQRWQLVNYIRKLAEDSPKESKNNEK